MALRDQLCCGVSSFCGTKQAPGLVVAVSKIYIVAGVAINWMAAQLLAKLA